jgi:hypothetical protein
MFISPSRSELNAMRRPSGEKRGWLSYAGPVRISVADPPVAGMV